MKLYTAALLCTAFAFCQEQETENVPISTDRPDQTETADLVPKGMFQMENGFSYEQADASTSEMITPSTLIKYGINDNFELRLIVEYSTVDTDMTSASGFKPILLGFKVKVAEEYGIIPKTSFIGHLSIPKLATKEFQNEFYAPEFRFVMQNTLSDRFKLGYNLGAEWDGDTAEPSFIYTLSLAFGLTDKFGAFVESYGFAPQKDLAEHCIDGGLTYLLSDNFMIDASGGFGVSDNAPDYFVSAGFSFRF